MKHLLTISLCFFIFSVKGQTLEQRIDSAEKIMQELKAFKFTDVTGNSDTPYVIHVDDSSIIYHLIPTWGSEEHPKVTLDTMPCILLVSDTSRQEISGSTKPYYKTSNSVTWMAAYEVREKHCCINGYSGTYAIYQPVPYYTHILYLDENKKELNPSILVWMVK